MPIAHSAAFEADRIALEQSRELPAACRDDFLRLARSIVHGPTFQWLLVEAPNEPLRKRVMEALAKVLRKARLRGVRLNLSDRIADVAALEERLSSHAREHQVVNVLGRPGWFSAERWDAFNARRERIAAQAVARLVFWLDGTAIAEASRCAPDLWAWRSGVYAFNEADAAMASGPSPAGAVPRPTPWGETLGSKSMSARHRRVAEIQDWLSSEPNASDELKLGPLDELGQLLHSVGDYEAALVHWRSVELPLHRARADERAAAITQGKIADILQAQGRFDEALRIRREEQLPVYERLGDTRSKAVAMGQIAGILQARGELDEALRIRVEEQLPVYERLGDARGKAVAMGEVAEILKARGQFDEALRIHQEEELPVYERLGDLRSKAVAKGRVADILQARGQLDEALRIRHEEELPVYERLGDVREKAVAMGKVADILLIRGQIDEALRIYTEEELPVYERLGDVHGKAVTQWKLALTLLDRPEPDLARAGRYFAEAHRALVSMRLPEAAALERQMHERGFTPE